MFVAKLCHDGVEERFCIMCEIQIAPEFRWWPGEDDPLPEGLSRHVVAHQPSADYFSRANGVIALMLMTSLLREQQAHCEDVRADDAAAEPD